ncbi:MAG: hypothetical protein FWH57_13105 [Oscillospiraceae bacterium]|nr:hypothetical protein [Oscillospiraceae bacterium]
MPKKIANISDPAMQNISLAGGKGAGLSKLMGIEGINVPKGFIVTTEAYHDIVGAVVSPFIQQLKENPALNLSDLSAEIKRAISSLVLSPDFEKELKEAIESMGTDVVFAIRSSATAEDLPDASFAGQQDTFLNILDFSNVKSAIIACFASLYNERAIAYRIKNQFNENDVSMAVVLQLMIPSQVSGVLFTADPISSDRCTVVVEAVEGLGEDLVSGRKSPATWHIKNKEVRLGTKTSPPLDEALIRTLAGIGEKIEEVFGQPQDIEWCYLDGQFYIVQARPITALYPAPKSHDKFKRCYMSFAHMQMMTDVMLPLGISFSRLLADFALKEAGGRLYIDITHDIKSIYGRKMVFQKAANLDPLMESALKDVVSRKEYIKSIPKAKGSFGTAAFLVPILKSAYKIYRRGTVRDIENYLEQHAEALQRLRCGWNRCTAKRLLT